MIAVPAILMAAALTMAGPDLRCDQTDRAPVNVLRNGDDGLTIRLADAVEAAFDNCSGFRVAKFDASRFLVVRITHNVTWKRVDERTRVFFDVEYVARRTDRSTLAGSCWEDELSDCAAQIVRAAPAVNMA